MDLIIKFLVLTAFVSGAIIFFLHRTLISSTDGAVKRLDEEIAKANAKQVELNKKLKEADEELEKRKTESREMVNKMRSEAEAEIKEDRNKIIVNARTEGEQIIEKAHNAAEKFKKELEQQFDLRVLNFSMSLLNKILSANAKGSFNDLLIDEFIAKLKDVDMTRIDASVSSADLVLAGQVDEGVKNKFVAAIKDKLGRSFTINASTDNEIAGGAILKFSSMALDGSLRNLIRDAAISLQQEIEARVI